MFVAKRKAQILESITKHQQISVNELSDQLRVSISTIRRDLSSLQKTGQIKRIRGGAVIEKRSLVDFSYLEREKKIYPAKNFHR